MALKLTVESFLQVVRQSGLIDKDQLQKLLQSYADRGVDVKRSQAIADALVGDEVLTRWQAEKLLSGKHKGFFLGKYKLLDLLGKGGMSSVYLAEHVLMKRRCAIKVLPAKRVHDSSYLARFHREAQAVASVDHPNIVRAYDVDCAQDRDTQIHFLVMEYVNGPSLQEVIIRNGPADYADAVDYIRQAAEGLEHAHRAGLVHRDIKPGNLLLDPNGTIKILDMGLARFFDDRDENPLTVAHDEKVLGTADYLAPEQALDSHSVDTRADIYSLGCTLYFFLTGHPPFTEGTLTQRLMWHQTKPFPPLTESRLDCPKSLITLLNKMVEKKPEDRFPSAAAVAEACRQWLADHANADWKSRHADSTRRNTPQVRTVTSMTRDLTSDSVTLSHVSSHVLGRGDSEPERDEAGSAATRISLPTTPPSLSEPPTTILSAPPVKSDAVPTAAPAAIPVIAPPVAPPMAVAVANPPSPPIARPVAVPVAMPVTPVAQPVKTAPVAAVLAPPVGSPPPPDVAPTPFFAPAAEAESAMVKDAAPPAEPPEATDLFSLFSGNTESAPTSTMKETAPPEMAPEASAPAIPDVDEPTLFDSPIASSTEAAPAEPSDLMFAPPSEPLRSTAPMKMPPKKPVALSQWVFIRYSALAAVAMLALGGIGWWLTRGSDDGGKSVATSGKKAAASARLSNGDIRDSAKSDAHEVTLVVGAGGDFKSIGRAVHSVIEGRADHEAAARGKPLRFVIRVKPGPAFEESLKLDESFPGELHLKSESPDKNFKLKSPAKEEPPITISNLDGVVIENASLDLGDSLPPKDKGIVLSGLVARCRIRNCVISGAGVAGIELNAAVGGEGSDGIVLDGITFQNAAPTAFGVHIAKAANNAPSQHVTVQRCRSIGSMSAAVFIEGSVHSLTIRNCGISGAHNGVRFANGVIAKSVVIDHCSFRNLSDSGLLFDSMPGAGSGEFTWSNCLFAGVSKSELRVAQDYDAAKFAALLSAEKPVSNNWSDRPATDSIVGEHDVLGKGGSRVTAIQFAATSPNSELFLVAKAGEPYKSAGVRTK